MAHALKSVFPVANGGDADLPRDFLPPSIRVRSNLRTDNEANVIHGRADHRDPGGTRSGNSPGSVSPTTLTVRRRKGSLQGRRDLLSGRRRRWGYRLRKRSPQNSRLSSVSSTRISSRIVSSSVIGKRIWCCSVRNMAPPCHHHDRAHEPLPGRVEERGEAHEAGHGADCASSDAPALACLPNDHLRSWLQIHRLAAPAGRGWHADMVLRGAAALAERCGGKRQQAA